MKLDKQCFIDRYDEGNLIYYEKDLDGKPGKVEFIYNWEYDLQRIKVALMEMSGEMMMTSDVKKVITNFQHKFSNSYIDSLCVAIIQALDSGEAVELLGDISEQLKSFQNAALMRKKQELDRALTFSSIVEFGAIMVFIIVISLGSLSIGSLF